MNSGSAVVTDEGLASAPLPQFRLGVSFMVNIKIRPWN
jgi:hypothetical protein